MQIKVVNGLGISLNSISVPGTSGVMLEHSTPSEQHQSSNLTTQCESQYEERASKAAEGERAAEADFTATAAPDGHESDSDSSMVNRNGDEEEEDDEPSAEIPYPGFERIVFKCLPQTHRLRLICLHLITSPYPFATLLFMQANLSAHKLFC